MSLMADITQQEGWLCCMGIGLNVCYTNYKDYCSFYNQVEFGEICQQTWHLILFVVFWQGNANVMCQLFLAVELFLRRTYLYHNMFWIGCMRCPQVNLSATEQLELVFVRLIKQMERESGRTRCEKLEIKHFRKSFLLRLTAERWWRFNQIKF